MSTTGFHIGDVVMYRLDDIKDNHTPIYRCPTCGRWRPWDDGGTDSDDCDDCWTLKQRVARRRERAWIRWCMLCRARTIHQVSAQWALFVGWDRKHLELELGVPPEMLGLGHRGAS